MKNCTQIYSEFWKAFDEVLKENGAPFKMTHGINGRTTSWACVNSHRTWRNASLEASITGGCKKLRVDIYIQDKRVDDVLYNKLFSNFELIKNRTLLPLKWENGSKGINTIRLACYVPIYAHDEIAYRRIIQFILPIYTTFLICE